MVYKNLVYGERAVECAHVYEQGQCVQPVWPDRSVGAAFRGVVVVENGLVVGSGGAG